MNHTMQITFWGVRGSYPVPGPQTLRFGGNTPCVEIQAGPHTLLLDAGTGIVSAGRALMKRAAEAGQAVQATLLFSHMHHDHTHGFPFFAPLYHGDTRLTILAPGLNGCEPDTILTRTMAPPNFPLAYDDLRATKAIHPIQEGQEILIGETCRLYPEGQAEKAREPDTLHVRLLRSYAHPNGVLLFRIEWGGHTVVYATDTEGYEGGDQRLIRFAEGADLLIHDSQYALAHYLGKMAGLPATQGYGHSTPHMACAVARSAGVKQLALFHFDPLYDDTMIAQLEQEAQGGFPAAFAAYEGLTLQLGGSIPEEPASALPVPDHQTTIMAE